MFLLASLLAIYSEFALKLPFSAQSFGTMLALLRHLIIDVATKSSELFLSFSVRANLLAVSVITNKYLYVTPSDIASGICTRSHSTFSPRLIGKSCSWWVALDFKLHFSHLKLLHNCLMLKM